MANGFLPFPTFGGEKSPGIMSVKFPTVPVRFPTAQRTRRAPAPTTKENIAGPHSSLYLASIEANSKSLLTF